MKTTLTSLLLLAAAALAGGPTHADNAKMPTVLGGEFRDNSGHHINAHGGNILKAGDTYYWYGEHRGDGTPGSGQEGVACYSSPDLRHWDYRGIVLPVSNDTLSPIARGSIIERPKVVYCPKTGRYVMWFHNELRGRGYAAAQAGVATADNPLGPFTLKSSARVNPGKWPLNLSKADRKKKEKTDLEWWTPEWYKTVESGVFTKRDHKNGQMARDMTIYVDPADGKAYHIYSSEENLTLQIAELDDTFEHHTGRYIRLFPGGHNEAPAIFRHGGKYWMVTSGCTGWAPNEARMMSADSIMGEWTMHPNPCRGEMAEKTFYGQGTYIFTDGDRATFMADVWNPKNLGSSRHIWLPVSFTDEGVPVIAWPENVICNP